MMKLIIVAIALCLAVVSAKTLSVDVGYASTVLAVKDGQTGYYQIPISASQAKSFISDEVGVEIVFNKHAAGDQDICISDVQVPDCNSGSASFITNKGVNSLADTFCYVFSGNFSNQDIWVSVAGTCKTSTSSTPCISSTDSDLESVRLYEVDPLANVDSKGCQTTRKYLPFILDSTGKNTALYSVNMDSVDGQNLGFIHPAVFINLTAASDVYFKLNIDEFDANNYAVDFHFSKAGCCAEGKFPDLCAVWDGQCAWNKTATADYIISPVTGFKMGDYSTGAVALSAGEWIVTPYVHDLGIGTLDFQFCGGVGAPCSPAFGLAPSLTILAAIFAVLFMIM